MHPLPYTDTGAGIAFYVTLAAFLVVEQRIRIRSWRNREGTRSDHGSFYVLAGAIGGGLLGAFWFAVLVTATAIAPGRWAAFVAGIVAMWAGIGLRQWAVALLAGSFTVDVRVREGQVVVDRGPYRVVRHPSYSGMLLTFLGIGLALGNWLSVVATVVVPMAGLVVRIRVEERALLAALGEPYRRFAAGRRRLVPGVW